MTLLLKAICERLLFHKNYIQRSSATIIPHSSVNSENNINNENYNEGNQS